MAKHTSQELRGFLDKFMREEGYATEGAKFYSHVLPSPQMPTLQQRPIAGQNWAMVGDAGALVDPITGEGLYYALRSGELLADALIAERPAEYPQRVRADFSLDLEFATVVARYVYRGRFLGASVTTRMIQFIDRSSTFRGLMADLFSGAQDYSSLKRRIWMQFGNDAQRSPGQPLPPRFFARAHAGQRRQYADMTADSPAPLQATPIRKRRHHARCSRPA